jgi:hypothetical protein
VDKLFIEGFDGKNGRSEVYEVIDVDASGIEQVRYEVLFKEERQVVASMGEASVLASELAGDTRFTDPGAQWHDLRR